LGAVGWWGGWGKEARTGGPGGMAGCGARAAVARTKTRGPLRGLAVGLAGSGRYVWVTAGFMITVWERKCLVFEHFRSQTMIMATVVQSQTSIPP
jgi:hypothetical protein